MTNKSFILRVLDFLFWFGVGISYIVLLLIYTSSQLELGPTNYNSRAKACKANMKLVENGLAMYDMDFRSDVGGSFIAGNGERINAYPLVKMKYIPKNTNCPENRNTEYQVFLEKVEKDLIPYVTCVEHGKASDVNGKMQSHRKNRKMMTILFLFLVVVLFFIWNFLGTFIGLNLKKFIKGFTVVFVIIVIIVILFSLCTPNYHW
ncbi:hypothetical protein KAJ27_10360 [bacterium]|nr:hypothetical protein [bacterium]